MDFLEHINELQDQYQFEISVYQSSCSKLINVQEMKVSFEGITVIGKSFRIEKTL